MSVERRLSRRQLLRKAAALGVSLAFVGPILAACGPTPTPKIVEKVVEKPVEKVVTKVVEKEVTKIVAGTPVKEVVKETVVVEKPVEKVVEKMITPTPAKKETITLRFHFRAGGETGSEKPIYVDRPEEFVKEYPYIQIKNETFPAEGGEYYRKIDTLIVAGTLGDVVFAEGQGKDAQRYIQKGAILPIDDWMKANGHSKEEWVQGAQNELGYQGKMYGMPKCCSPSAMMIWISHKAFKEAGIPIPGPYDLTHDKLKEWSLKLSKGPKDKRDVHGFNPDARSMNAVTNQVRSFGGFVVAEDGLTSLADSEPFAKFAAWNYDLYQTDKVSPLPGTLQTSNEAMFAAEKLTMFHSGRWSFKSTEAAVKALAKPFEWSVHSLPRYEYSKGWIASVDTHAATTFSKHPDEALRFSYALADRRFAWIVANRVGYLTARVDDLDVIGDIANTPFMRLQYKTNLETVRHELIKNLRGNEHFAALTNELDKMWLGKEKPTAEFLKSVKKACEGVLSKPPA